MALACGGLAQFLAGMWEFANRNTFGATGEPRSTDCLSPRFFQFMAIQGHFLTISFGFANTNIDSPL